MEIKTLTVAAGLALIASACGAPEADTQPTEAREQPLRAFGNWTQTPGGLSFRAPVIIPSDTAGTMMAAVGLDNQIYTTSTQDPGGIGATWRKVSSFGPSNFPASVVAGVGLLGETGAMANAVVLAVNRGGQIYIRVQNQTGSVVFHDWDPIPVPLLTSFAGISMTWLPRFSLSGSQRMLILVAHKWFDPGNPDAFVYVAGNTLTGGVYNHANWTSFNQMALPGGGALPGNNPPPRDSLGNAFNYTPLWVAAAWACPPSSNDYSLVVAASQLRDAIDGDAKTQVIYFTKYNALGGGWTRWTEVDRTFLSGSFGLAAGCGEFTHEMTIAGMEPDGRVYVDAKQISGRPPSWSAIGTQTFGPQIQGPGEFAHVSAGYSGGLAWVTAVNVLSLDYATAPTP